MPSVCLVLCPNKTLRNDDLLCLLLFMAGSIGGAWVDVLVTRDVRPFFSNMNLLHNEGCDYGTFARAKRCCQTRQAVSQPASLSFFISHVLDAPCARRFTSCRPRPPVHMLTLVMLQPIAPP